MTPSVQNRKRRLSRARGGFSLVEALVVVAIAGILATIAFDEGVELIRTSRAQAAGSQVALTLQRARQNAVVEKVPFFVRIVADPGGRVDLFEILRDDGSGALEVGADEVVQAFRPEIAVFLDDGMGNSTDLPAIAPDEYAVAFGLRGEARDPQTRAVLSAFLNVSSIGVERRGWAKFTAIAIRPAGAIEQHTVRRPVGGDYPSYPGNPS